MSFATLNTAIFDTALQQRTNSCAQQEARENPELMTTELAARIRSAMFGGQDIFIWDVAIATEAEYASALAAGVPNPGGDESVITDGMILSAVQASGRRTTTHRSPRRERLRGLGPDDAFDTQPPDPEQVAFHWEHLREQLEELLGRPVRTWDELPAEEQQLLLDFGAFIVDWLATHGEHNPIPLARAIHEAREAMDPTLPHWDDFNDDDRAIGVALTDLVIAWLRRQGATA